MSLITIILLVIVAGFSAIIHEIAHGYMAFKLGDNTAKLAGRLTLNPLKHIDLISTIILPAVLILFHIPPLILFKPVPISIQNLNNPRSDARLVALAGPLSNFLLILLVALIFRTFFKNTHSNIILTTGYFFVIINLVLGTFNLIPLPPLDGSWILSSFLPYKGLKIFNQIKTYLIILFLFLIFSGLFQYIWTPTIEFLYTIAKFILFK